MGFKLPFCPTHKIRMVKVKGTQRTYACPMCEWENAIDGDVSEWRFIRQWRGNP